MYQKTPYRGEDAQKIADDASDQDEDAMVNDYREQLEFNDGMDDSERGTTMGSMPDMQANLVAAATPLEPQASLQTKLESYDSYCNLFHFILNSEGPVDVDIPSVSLHPTTKSSLRPAMPTNVVPAVLGLGRHRRVHISI